VVDIRIFYCIVQGVLIGDRALLLNQVWMNIIMLSPFVPLTVVCLFTQKD
jgi:hypothetical protein